jgi:YbbR domain-containing protein
MSEQKQKKDKDKAKTEKRPKKSKGDFHLKIISVLTAVLIWFWVFGFESQVAQRRFASVPVIFENANEMRDRYGYSILVDKELYIDVVLEGQSAYLNRIRPESIHAFVDLNRVTQAGEQPLPIEIKEMDYVHVADQSQSSTLLYIDKESSKPIPVDARIVQMVKEPDVEIGELGLSANSVTVYGPEEVLKTISHAQVNLSLGTVERPVTVTETLVLINNNGEEVRNQYISTRDVTTVEVFVPVTMTKEVPLILSYRHGYYNDKNTNITIVPETIFITGSPDFINSIHEYNIGVIDEKKYERDTTETMRISLPAGVTSDVHAAEIGIKFIDIEPKLINVSTRQNANFNIIPPANFEYRIREDRIQIRLLGHPSVLRFINSSRISVTADMSALTERGTHPVPLGINIISNNAENPAFCVGEYLITVEIY